MQKQARKEKEKEFKQNLITDSAKVLFAEKGFEETTMEDIAQAAGFAKGTVYLYFKSKNEIMASIVISVYDDLISKVEDMSNRSIPAIEKMQDLTKLYHDFVHTSIGQYGFGNMWKSIENMSDFFTIDTKEDICRQNKKIFGVVQKIILEGQAEGVFCKDLDSLYTSIAITAFTSGLDHTIFLHNGLLKELDIDIAKLLEASMKLIEKCLK